jgi:hypothetical protein
VNDDNDSLHLKPSVTSQRRLIRLRVELAGFPEVARCYTIGAAFATPKRTSLKGHDLIGKPASTFPDHALGF